MTIDCVVGNFERSKGVGEGAANQNLPMMQGPTAPGPLINKNQPETQSNVVSLAIFNEFNPIF